MDIVMRPTEFSVGEMWTGRLIPEGEGGSGD